jgi:multisubunit Na+/H+ antiporter MnhE subunit
MQTEEITAAEGSPPPRTVADRIVLLIVAAYALAFVVFGVLVDGPSAVLSGLTDILLSRDTLLTDYMGLGGIGAATVNAGLLTLAACLVYLLSGARMTGAAVAALFLVLGFGLFGKNLLNVWFIVAGVALYCRVTRKRFADNINTAFFGAALAPIISEILFSTTLSFQVSVPLALGTGLVIGFILPPAAAQLFRAHDGFALYNMGFTAGLVGPLVVAIYTSYGFVAEPIFIWTSGNNLLLGVFLGGLFLSMLVLGFALDRAAGGHFLQLLREPGRSPSDFIAGAGFGASLLNMGLSGAVGLAYILAVGGDLNGPTIGALLSIVGFGAFGKHPRNIVPIMAGVFLASLLKPWGAAEPGALLAALFGTNLAPIAGTFGWHWGLVAGFVHASAALSVGSIHGGLNLYNNGFAAGIVAAILVPVIVAIRSRKGDATGAATAGQPAVVRPAPTGTGLLRAALLRGLGFLGFWLLLAAPDLRAAFADPVAAAPDLLIALAAVVIATWLSLRLLPPRPRALRPGPMLLLGWRFLAQSVVAGVDVARRVFDPRLPIQPGLVVYRPRLRDPHRQSVLATLSSAAPGTLAVGTDAEGNLIYHVLDTRLPVADGLAADERLLLRMYRDDGEQARR